MKKFLLAFILFALFACGGDSDTPTPTIPTDPEPEEYTACLTSVTAQSLDIITWNIQDFPKRTSTAASVLQIIDQMDPDVIALQEITSQSAFADLLSELNGWTGFLEQFNGSNLMLGYLFKNSEVTVTSTPANLYADQTDDNNFAFTAFRRPLLTTIQHINGLEVSLINVHLKCCDGSEDRRRRASVLIKEYIDNNQPDDMVVVLGDYNDDIVDQTDNVFQNFVDDPDDYRFATFDVATGAATNWSYPSWPSHLDNILITDELFDKAMSAVTVKLDDCNSTYLSTISDHRPVMMRVTN